VESLSQRLAEFAHDLVLDALPDDVVEHVKLLVLDAAGLCLAARDEDFIRPVLEVVEELGGPPESRPLGIARAMPAPSAALVGGALIHGLDFDDSHAGSTIHTSSSVVPVALALGELQRRPGPDVLMAIAVGLEVNARIGLGAGDGFHRRGFHPTGVCGCLAASVTAGRLLGLEATSIAQAMGISGSMAGGLREAYLGGDTWTKRLHPGWAGHAGIIAARLAARGFSGPEHVLDGRFGLYNAMLGSGNWDASRVLHGLGETWEIRRIGFKPYPCGVVIHPFLDALEALMVEHGLRGDEIARMHCRVAPGALETVCEPVGEKLRPANEYQAKFSLQFCLAALALRGTIDIDTFRPETARDPAILDLAARVSCAPDPSQPYPRRHTAELQLTTHDARSFSRSEAGNRGGPDMPMTSDEVRHKFRANAARSLPAERVQALEQSILALESLPDTRRILECALPAAALSQR
jgi:2-methylcitrate dehydratase PrpD